jgi:hypothetical protein
MKAALVALTLWPCTSAAQSAFTDEFLNRFAEPLVSGVPFDLDGLTDNSNGTYRDFRSGFEVEITSRNGADVAFSFAALDLTDGVGTPYPPNLKRLRTEKDIEAVIERFTRFAAQAEGFSDEPDCISSEPGNDATRIVFAKALVRPGQNGVETALISLRIDHVLTSYLEPDRGGRFGVALLAASGPDITCHLRG